MAMDMDSPSTTDHTDGNGDISGSTQIPNSPSPQIKKSGKSTHDVVTAPDEGENIHGIREHTEDNNSPEVIENSAAYVSIDANTDLNKQALENNSNNSAVKDNTEPFSKINYTNEDGIARESKDNAEVKNSSKAKKNFTTCSDIGNDTNEDENTTAVVNCSLTTFQDIYHSEKEASGVPFHANLEDNHKSDEGILDFSSKNVPELQDQGLPIDMTQSGHNEEHLIKANDKSQEPFLVDLEDSDTALSIDQSSPQSINEELNLKTLNQDEQNVTFINQQTASQGIQSHGLVKQDYSVSENCQPAPSKAKDCYDNYLPPIETIQRSLRYASGSNDTKPDASDSNNHPMPNESPVRPSMSQPIQTPSNLYNSRMDAEEEPTGSDMADIMLVNMLAGWINEAADLPPQPNLSELGYYRGDWLPGVVRGHQPGRARSAPGHQHGLSSSVEGHQLGPPASFPGQHPGFSKSVPGEHPGLPRSVQSHQPSLVRSIPVQHPGLPSSFPGQHLGLPRSVQGHQPSLARGVQGHQSSFARYDPGHKPSLHTSVVGHKPGFATSVQGQHIGFSRSLSGHQSSFARNDPGHQSSYARHGSGQHPGLPMSVPDQQLGLSNLHRIQYQQYENLAMFQPGLQPMNIQDFQHLCNFFNGQINSTLPKLRNQADSGLLDQHMVHPHLENSLPGIINSDKNKNMPSAVSNVKQNPGTAASEDDSSELEPLVINSEEASEEESKGRRNREDIAIKYQKEILQGVKLSKWKEKIVRINNGCLICGAPSSGSHYKVLACEGCKGFFRRTVTKCVSYRCKKYNNCPVDKTTRRRCQACRFSACLAKGMSIESVVSRMNKKPPKEKLDKLLAQTPSLGLQAPDTPPSSVKSEEILPHSVDTPPPSVTSSIDNHLQIMSPSNISLSSSTELPFTSPDASSTELSVTSPPVSSTEFSVTSPPASSIELSVTSPPALSTELSVTPPLASSTELSVTSPPVSSTELSVTSPPASTELSVTSSPVLSTDLSETSPPESYPPVEDQKTEKIREGYAASPNNVTLTDSAVERADETSQNQNRPRKRKHSGAFFENKEKVQKIDCSSDTMNGSSNRAQTEGYFGGHFGPGVSNYIGRPQLHLLTQPEQEFINKLLTIYKDLASPSPQDLRAIECGVWSEMSVDGLFVKNLTETTNLVALLVLEYSKKLPGFKGLSENEQNLQLKRSSSKCVLLRLARSYLTASSCIMLTPSLAYHILPVSFSHVDITPVLTFFHKVLTCNLDSVEYAIMTAICVFEDNLAIGILQNKQVRQVQMTYRNLLITYEKSKTLDYNNRVNMMLDLLGNLSGVCQVFEKSFVNAVQYRGYHLPDLICQLWGYSLAVQ